MLLKIRFQEIILVCHFILPVISTNIFASEDLHGSLANLPVLAASSDKGILVDFLKSMQKSYPEGKITFEVLPFKRSIKGAIRGEVDFHAPILKHPKATEAQRGYTYSEANIHSVIFALYTHRDNKKINPRNLSKFNIETESAHVDFFDFPTTPSSCIECSLKKVNSGRIDGFIFAALESDTIVRSLNLKNIKSWKFESYEGKFVLPLGEKGKRTNAILNKIIQRTHENGDFQKAFGRITDYYKNWKPIE